MNPPFPADALALVCPRCRRLAPHSATLAVHGLRGERSGLPACAGALDDEPALACTNPHCRARYPVLDGIAIIFATPGAIGAATHLPLDLCAMSPATLRALAELAGPDSALAEHLARLARHARCGFDDWLTIDGAALTPSPDPSHGAALMAWLEDLGEARHCAVREGAVRGVLGAAMGREGWAPGGIPTLLVDAWLPALLAARRLARDGALDLVVSLEPGRWRDARITVPEAAAPAALALVCCDAADPPLLAGCLASVVLSNLVDSVAEPFVVLGQAAALRADDGLLAVSSPFTWRASITPVEHWLSQLPRAAGSSEDGLLAVLGEVAPELVPRARTELAWSVPNGLRERAAYTSVARLFGPASTPQ